MDTCALKEAFEFPYEETFKNEYLKCRMCSRAFSNPSCMTIPCLRFMRIRIKTKNTIYHIGEIRKKQFKLANEVQTEIYRLVQSRRITGSTG